MHNFNQLKKSQESFQILKKHLQEENGIKKRLDRKQIKINKSKLPFDFFKRSVERSLTRKSPLESYSINLSTEKPNTIRKQPQTQRRIVSHHNIPLTQFDHAYDFNLSRTEVLKFDNEKPNLLHRRMLFRQQQYSNDEQITAQKKCFQNVKAKSSKVKQTNQNKLQIKVDHSFLKRQNSSRNRQNPHEPTPLQSLKYHLQKTENIQLMGCTFGKSFKKGQFLNQQNSVNLNTSLQHTITNEDKTNQIIEEDIQRENNDKNRNLACTPSEASHKKQKQQKSTEQSEIMEALKGGQYSPIKNHHRRKLFAQQGQVSCFENPPRPYNLNKQERVNQIHWNIYSNDILNFHDFSMQKTKEVFTSEQRQRKIKYKNQRQNNSSSEYRQQKQRFSSLKKEKRFAQVLNLPRIDKALNIGKNLQVVQGM